MVSGNTKGIQVPNGLTGKDMLDINWAEPAGKEPYLQDWIEQLKMYLQHGKGCLDRIVTKYFLLTNVSHITV